MTMIEESPTGAPSYKWVGSRSVRPDGLDKVTGKARFGADLTLPGMLEGAVARSPHAHARIVSIDTSAAEAMARCACRDYRCRPTRPGRSRCQSRRRLYVREDPGSEKGPVGRPSSCSRRCDQPRDRTSCRCCNRGCLRTAPPRAHRRRSTCRRRPDLARSDDHTWC